MMSGMKTSVCLCFVLAGICWGSLPEPLIYLPFDGQSWDNQGAVGYDTASAVIERNGYKPSLSIKDGIAGGALDQRGFPYFNQPFTDPETIVGSVEYGTNLDDPNAPALPDTPIQEAFDGLKSFTIMGWLRGTIGGGSRILSRLNAPATDNGFQLLCPAIYSGQLQLLVNGNSSSIDTGNNNFYDNLPHEWIFFAVTYDGTSSFMNLNWYKGYDDGTDSIEAFPMASSLVAGEVQVHNPGNPLWVGNSGQSGAWPFSGMIDEIRIFGSTEDTSGVLTPAQIGAFKAMVYEDACGAEGFPYPAGDINGDCVVNMADFKLLAENWLNDALPETE